MANDEMNNDEFVDYVEAHSHTDRALFSPEHVKRLHKLAGHPEPDINVFTRMPNYAIGYLIDAARVRNKAGVNDEQA